MPVTNYLCETYVRRYSKLTIQVWNPCSKTFYWKNILSLWCTLPAHPCHLPFYFTKNHLFLLCIYLCVSSNICYKLKYKSEGKFLVPKFEFGGSFGMSLEGNFHKVEFTKIGIVNRFWFELGGSLS
jgi:hypothetical protein